MVEPAHASKGPDLALASCAIRLLSSSRDADRANPVAASARRAIESGLAGLFGLGVLHRQIAGDVDPEIDVALARAARHEAAAYLAVRERARRLLSALADVGIEPVVLKGAAFAERYWPEARMRPPGDLDLLVPESELGAALAALARNGYRPVQGGSPGRWRPAFAGVDLWPPDAGVCVDLHTRLFRSVGSGIESEPVLARGTSAVYCGIPVRRLDAADEIVFTVIHAALHGAVRIKWMLDLHALALARADDMWDEAARRAAAAGASRPFWAGARWIPKTQTRSVRSWSCPNPPPVHLRPIIRRLVAPGDATIHPLRARLGTYGRAWFLEERRAVRYAHLAGVVERKAGEWFGRYRGPAVSDGAVTPSRRWLEAALRRGDSGSVWLSVRGDSMAPVVRDGDRLLVAPCAGARAPREGTIVIAKHPSGLVAHRLVGLSNGTAVTRGDARSRDDGPLDVREILGEVIAIDTSNRPTHRRDGGAP